MIFHGNYDVTHRLTGRQIANGAGADVIMHEYSANFQTVSSSPIKLPNATLLPLGIRFVFWITVPTAIQNFGNVSQYSTPTGGKLVVGTLISNGVANGTWIFESLADLGINALSWKNSVNNILNTPPLAPACDDRYLVGTAPVGAWVGFTNHLAQWDCVNNVWVFEGPPADGWAVVNETNDTIYIFDGLNWITLGVGAGLVNSLNGLNDNGTTVFLGGPLNQNTTIDGISTYNLLLQNLTNFAASAVTSINFDILGVTKPALYLNGTLNKLQVRTANSFGVAGDVLQSDGAGSVVWGPTPAFPGLTAANNGLYTNVSTVRMGGPLIENTVVTTNGFSVRFGDVATLGLLPAPVADEFVAAVANSLILSCGAPIRFRTGGSFGAPNDLLISNGTGTVWTSLTSLITTVNPYSATAPVNITGTVISITPSGTFWDVLTTNGAGVVVWSSFSSNPVFNTVVNNLINTYINSPTFFTTNNTFTTNLLTYLTTNLINFPVTNLAPGLVGQVLTTTAGPTVTWQFPTAGLGLTSSTNLLTITTNPTNWIINLFAQATLANQLLVSTGPDTYSWQLASSVLGTHTNLTKAGVALSVPQPFVEILDLVNYPSPNYKHRQFVPGDGIQLFYEGNATTQGIRLNVNTVLPLEATAGVLRFAQGAFANRLLVGFNAAQPDWLAAPTIANQVLAFVGGNLVWTAASGLVSACATNGLSIIGGCVGLGGTMTQPTTILGAGNTMNWNAFFEYNIRTTGIQRYISQGTGFAEIDVDGNGFVALTGSSIFPPAFGVFSQIVLNPFGTTGKGSWVSQLPASLGASITLDSDLGYSRVSVKSGPFTGGVFTPVNGRGYFEIATGLILSQFDLSSATIAHNKIVTLVATGGTIFLPASPINGQTHRIVLAALFAVVGVLTITATGETFRHNGAASATIDSATHRGADVIYLSGQWHLLPFTNPTT